MTRMPLMLALTFAALPAQAISRHNSESMSCAAVQSLLQQEEAAIISHRGRNASVYDRYVGSQQYCKLNEATRTVYVPTTDTKSCRVLACDIRPDTNTR